MELANNDRLAKRRPLQKALAKDRRARLDVVGRPSSMTLANYLLERWLPLVETGIEPTTASSYRQHVEGHIVPYIGHIRVGTLDRATVQAF